MAQEHISVLSREISQSFIYSACREIEKSCAKLKTMLAHFCLPMREGKKCLTRVVYAIIHASLYNIPMFTTL